LLKVIMSKRGERVIVVGAGIGGLVAALELAARGFAVTVVERAARPGGKMRVAEVGPHQIDAGPTVLTMKWVFDEIFAAAGTSLADHMTLVPLDILARHAWGPDQRLDLYADVGRSADAIGRFSGSAEAARYLKFCERARTTYETLKQSFILAPNPSPLSLTASAGLRGLGDLWRVSPFSTLWNALGEYFHDPRLHQLFGRYATYCGSSPFEAPATLMLIAHVEREGVWTIKGGMHTLAETLANLAQKRDAKFRYETEVEEILVEGGRASGVRLTSGERIGGDMVVVNADTAAVARGLLGLEVAESIKISSGSKSLSAVTWAMTANVSGFDLSHHNVFFSNNYQGEFDDIFREQRLPSQPTVYVCAQDRGDAGAVDAGPERLFALVNAPPNGEIHSYSESEIELCTKRTFGHLQACGLTVKAEPSATITTTPSDFAKLFPGTNGSLYGRASHGWAASFARPTGRTSIPGLFLAGGSVHPGPGVPMAAISGRLAAASIIADLRSTRR
jgi:1-hydroxycarotenoid 3,4-desaturase